LTKISYKKALDAIVNAKKQGKEERKKEKNKPNNEIMSNGISGIC
jgi:non-homologous end joining protein Ku